MTFLTGLAIGAGLMYILDPDRGNRRRALARDQVVSAAHTVEDTVSGRSQDIRNRAQGVIAETRGALTEEPVSDRVLEERVRAELGRATRHAGAIEVRANQGRVTLTGPVLASDVDSVISSVSSVRGVKDVENRLDVHQQPDDVPALQG